MLPHKTLAKCVALALATGSVLTMTSAHAAVQFNSFHATRIVACDQAVALEQPEALEQAACGTNPPPNRYLVDFTIGVSNSVTPAPGTPGAAEPVSVTVNALDSAFGAGNWTLVSVSVGGDGNLVASGFNGTTILDLASSPSMAEGQSGSVTLAVEATITGTTFPTLRATVNEITRDARVFVPLQPEGAVVGETCAASYSPGTVEFIQNGGFTTLNGSYPKATSSATDLIAGSFYSDVPLVFEGFNEYRDNKSISIHQGSLASRYAQQQPLSTTKLNWLRHGGGALTEERAPIDDQPQRFWKQSVSNLVVGREYLVSAYFTNISEPGQPQGLEPTCQFNHEPRVQFVADQQTVGNSPVTLEAETDTSGDSWRKIQGTFKATATEMEIAIENSQIGWCYNQLGVTDISMRACLKAGETENTPVTPTDPTPTDPTPTDPTPIDSTPTSGGGGALGAGLLTLLGLGAMRRRRGASC